MMQSPSFVTHTSMADAGSPPATRLGLADFIVQLGGLTVGRGVALVLSGIWAVVAARYLSPAAFGDLSLLLAISSICMIFGDLGMQVLLAEGVARAGRVDGRAVRVVLRKRLALTGLPAAVTVVMYGLAASDRSVEIPLLFVGTYAGTAVYSTITSALRAVGRVRIEAANEAFSRVGVLGLGWWWLAQGGGLRAAVAVYVLADVLSAVAVFIAARRAVTEATGQEMMDITIRRALPLALGFALANVYGRIDVWLVAWIDGSVSAGRYAAASKILDAVLVPSIAVGALAITWTAALDGRPLRRAVVRLTIAGIATSLPGAAIAWTAASWTMVKIFGSSYVEAVPTLRLLTLAAPSAAIVAALSPIAATRGRGHFVLVVGGALGINVALNLVLVPEFGAAGAAVAWVASQSVLAAALIAVTLVAAPSVGATTVVRPPLTSLAPGEL